MFRCRAGERRQPAQRTVQKSISSIQINPLTPAQAAQKTAPVSGTLSAGVTGAAVNGVPATITGGTWEAANVPIANDGQAVITLTATDAQSQTVTLSSQTESDPVIRISPL